MKRIKILLMTLIVILSVISFTSPASAAGYYYNYKGYSGNNYQFVKSKSFVNAVKYGKVTINKSTVVPKVKEDSLLDVSEDILTYYLEDSNIKSKYIKRKYDTVTFLNDDFKVYGIEFPVKKGKVTKSQFIKMFGKKYGEIEFIEGKPTINYKFKYHYFSGTFDKKNRLTHISLSSHVSGQAGKDTDALLFGK